MIQVNDLVKRYDSFTALDGLSLSAPKGSVYGLVGPNGAGKSTLIRTLTGIFRPDAGTVLIDSQPVYENPAVKERIAYIPDDVFFYGSATIKDMLSFYKSIYPRFSPERSRLLADAFGLDTGKQMRRLSKGMQKQAAFLIALSCCPDILVLDEPVDGLDPVMRRQVWNTLLAEVASQETTVLVSSHNLRELEDVCDRVGILNKGKMLLERSLADLQDNIVKVQLAYGREGGLPQGLDILNDSCEGSVRRLILRGKGEELREKIAASHPLFLDVMPLTLEEIFIYETGGAGYEIKDILL